MQVRLHGVPPSPTDQSVQLADGAGSLFVAGADDLVLSHA